MAVVAVLDRKTKTDGGSLTAGETRHQSLNICFSAATIILQLLHRI